MIRGALWSMLALTPLLGVAGAAAPDGVPARPRAVAQAHEPLDTAALGAFLDSFFADAMAEHHVAGATVAVVQGGEVALARGYGLADVERGVAVDPERTMFHIGSVGKVFTWTALMQLAEREAIDLDADIDDYLGLGIPATFAQPITPKDLMAHTSGFGERWLDSLAASPDELVPTRDWLLAHMPTRVFAPGARVGYSNYNAMLAGHLVERVSGVPYDAYVQEHIFDPLGMVHSTARSPAPPALRDDVARGYTYSGGALRPFPDYPAQPVLWPSGAHQASAADMARFMIALLGDGQAGGGRILAPATARRMLGTLYTPDPRLMGMAYGLAEVSDNGERALGHEGYFPPMRSQLLLLPERGLGLFVAYSGPDTMELVTQHVGLQRAFFDHFFPAPAAEPIEPPTGFAARAGRFAGLYRSASAPTTTFEKAMWIMGGDAVRIADARDGTLRLSIGPYQWRFAEVDELYFRQVDGPFALLFRADARGRIAEAYTDLMPQYANVRVPWYEAPRFNLALLLACVAAFVSLLVVEARRALRARATAAAAEPRGTARWARRALVAVSALDLLFVLGMVPASRPPTELHGPQPIVHVVLALGVASGLLTLVALGLAARAAWASRQGRPGLRALDAAVLVAALAFVWFLGEWNLLGWRY